MTKTIQIHQREHVNRGDFLHQGRFSPWGLPRGTAWEVLSIAKPKRNGMQTARVKRLA